MGMRGQAWSWRGLLLFVGCRRPRATVESDWSIRAPARYDEPLVAGERE
jgi:hypothetical protein